MNLEDLPEINGITLEELSRRVKKGETFVFAERVSFEFESQNGEGTRRVPAVEVGKDVTEKDLERLSDVERYPHIIRENGKTREDPVEVFDFNDGRDKKSFFQKFGKGVELVERVHPMAREYRAGVLEGAKNINMQLIHLLRAINLQENHIGRRAEEQSRLSRYLLDSDFGNNLNKALGLAARDPVTFTYLTYAPEAAEHGVDVGLLAGAIVIGAGMKDDTKLLHLARAGFIHDAGDEWFRRTLKIGPDSDMFKRLYPIRDFLVPRKMLTASDGNFIDGVDASVLEAVEHHHTKREGRRIDLESEAGSIRSVAYISRDARTNLDYMNSRVFQMMAAYIRLREEGKVGSLEEIKTILHEPLYLAEYWVTSMNRNKTKLNAATQMRKLEEGSGTIARPDFVKSLKNIVEQKYF